MGKKDNPRERYFCDAEFRTLVNSLLKLIENHQLNFTTFELKQAFNLALTMYEELSAKPKVIWNTGNDDELIWWVKCPNCGLEIHIANCGWEFVTENQKVYVTCPSCNTEIEKIVGKNLGMTKNKEEETYDA